MKGDTFSGIHKGFECFSSATYNNTLGIETEIDLSCRLILLSCLTTVPGIPGQVYLIKVYGVLNGRRSIPGSVYHSTSTH
ncbi:hypothetical protein KUTeg_006764 [Tegillarca granosa]|uniref:Uncharacterized protein n=1 Tax=Tegillarca granosa TaxID=220873 RepID=A0ABQ9FB93_TEGGR|nr:hypothetical protein KUTeg_006764 [Tegillarca granosa]